MYFNIDLENAKRVWKLPRKDFTVELVNWRHQVGGPEKWNIYVYVYPDHKWYAHNRHLFSEELLPHQYLNKINDMDVPPMHRGINFLVVNPGSIQLGCDYQHDGDDFYSTEIDPYTFEYDLKVLIEWFENYNPNGEVQDERVKAPSDKGGTMLSLDELYQIVNKNAMSEV